MPRLGEKLRGRGRLGLLGLGFALLLVAWVMSNQPFSAPDEASHYLRALGIANGQLLGRKIPYDLPSLTPTQSRFINYDTALVMVPRAMRPPDVACRSDASAPECPMATPSGNFPPLPYLLPAAAVKVSHDATTGLWLARVGSALPSLLLILLALAVLWDGTALSELGLLAAISPMVLFSSSILNPSGPEIAASLAFGASTLRISRDPVRAPTWVFGALAVSGAVAILSGPIGLIFAAAFVVLGLALIGTSGVRELSRQRLRPFGAAVAALAVATILSLIWRRVSGIAPGMFGISPLLTNLHHGADQLPEVLRDSVGTFGSLTIGLPQTVYWLAWICELALIAAAVSLARHRDRLLLTIATVLAILFPVLFWAWIDRLTGFGLQGREVLPVIALIPLIAGEMIHRSRHRLLKTRAARGVLALALACLAGFQAYSWWFNARAMAGAPGTLRFYAHAVWKPPLGWMPWIVLAILGTLSFLAFAASELRSYRRVEQEAALLAA